MFTFNMSLSLLLGNCIQKPKWLLNRDGDNTPSRASSPNGSVGSLSQQYSARKHISVTPFKKRGRRAGTRGSRGGRGGYVARPSLVVTRGNDYHYGSDFDSASDSDGRRSGLEDEELDVMESDDNLPLSESEAELEEYPDSDYSLSNQSSLVTTSKSGRWAGSSAPTPLPFWLQSDREIPRLELPKSSEDLLLPPHQVLPACAIYEVLRKFSSEVGPINPCLSCQLFQNLLLFPLNQVRLSPFRLEEFLAALQSEELTCLLAEVHIQLLRAMLREEDAQQTWFGPLDQKDSTNSMLHFSDALTWPEVLRVYMQSDPVVFDPALRLLESCEYPFTTVAIRLKVLKFLTDHFLCNTAVRQEILSEGMKRIFFQLDGARLSLQHFLFSLGGQVTSSTTTTAAFATKWATSSAARRVPPFITSIAWTPRWSTCPTTTGSAPSARPSSAKA